MNWFDEIWDGKKFRFPARRCRISSWHNDFSLMTDIPIGTTGWFKEELGVSTYLHGEIIGHIGNHSIGKYVPMKDGFPIKIDIAINNDQTVHQITASFLDDIQPKYVKIELRRGSLHEIRLAYRFDNLHWLTRKSPDQLAFDIFSTNMFPNPILKMELAAALQNKDWDAVIDIWSHQYSKTSS